MTEPDKESNTDSSAAAQTERNRQEKLRKLRARLAEGAASPIVEDFDPDQFLEEMHRKYVKD
ncbi:MAG: type II toxin-antitoxin system ParD family antitoxin [Candidatus Thiodiazotropha taylori]|nr:type II toxin-antitoxin system ParD family antitoxin [Candidatus Thiodiazotropha taylori]MCW4250755.1 type II toxin-antitoxin system ParD family antitoxin [Candidatus Thiodiazotropha endolucinida]MCG8073712.1 type II toxin-antitoxin system ParD family antitoxin [Candidatus Thiodiazotropha taylori]MCG8113282.1 type II toxin-antitoxin system ParD family antitoxin [Candidatus Thiodiazotropha taylori]MCW4285643.1 type II toxin-antitoxin system ParD family antitoxin [Candidatus Thiodiazotropha ta